MDSYCHSDGKCNTKLGLIDLLKYVVYKLLLRGHIVSITSLSLLGEVEKCDGILYLYIVIDSHFLYRSFMISLSKLCRVHK